MYKRFSKAVGRLLEKKEEEVVAISYDDEIAVLQISVPRSCGV